MDRSGYDSFLAAAAVMSVIGLVSIAAAVAFFIGRGMERSETRERFRLIDRDSWGSQDLAFVVNVTQRRIFTTRGSMLPDTVSVDIDGDRVVLTQKALSMPVDDIGRLADREVIN